MKVSLVVAAGAHEGRVIPIIGSQFLIGRDQQCQLRPASQAISKLHCAILIRDDKVFIKDYGSTNGTLVNDNLVQNAEVAVESGASIRVGPLDFRVQIDQTAQVDGTPLPGGPVEAAALAALKATAAAAAAAAAKGPARDTTPSPVKPAGVAGPSGARPGISKPAAPPATPQPA